MADGELNLTAEERDRLREHFSEIPLHKLLDLSPVQVGQEPITFEMPVRAEAFNPSGNLHGGAIATLIDVTAGTAAALGSRNFQPGENTLVTADMHVRYLGRAKSETVRAEGRVLRAGRQLTVVECQVLDANDRRVIASADFSAMVVPFREPLRAGQGDAREPDL